MDKEQYFEKIAEYKLLAKHEVGQNFLIDPLLAERIVALAGIKAQDRVLEIGSGAGSLSYFIALHSSEADLIDIDEALVAKLQKDFRGRINIHPLIGNAMRFPLSAYSVVIGNLPYYITSGIIERILLNATEASRAVLMVQKEALQRLCSPIGTGDYGPLNILISYVGKVEKSFVVSRNSFTPAPHVDSVVFVIRFYDDKAIRQKAARVYETAQAMFLCRRKTISNNLRNYLHDETKATKILEKLAVDAKKRPEELPPSFYADLSAELFC